VELDLSNNRIGSAGAVRLAAAACRAQQLKLLNIMWNPMSASAAAYVYDAIQSRIAVE
jgi:hypothetical protein